MRNAVRTLALVALCAAAWPETVSAASKEIERMLIQMANVQSQLADIQRTTAGNAAEIKRLGELVAEQNAAIRKLLQDQKLQDEAVQATLKEIEDRLSDISTRPASAPVPMSGAADASATAEGQSLAGAPPPAPDPRDLFSQAYKECLNANYDLGIQEFREFLRVYPATDRSDNALYWIGECYFGKQSYADALDTWETLIRDFPSSDKIVDARVKKGIALEKLGRRKEALVQFKYVVEHYPNSEGAKLARTRLTH